MAAPIVYGAAYSVYVRAVRMTLAEKGAPYVLVPVDVFAPGGPPAEHFARQPFGKIPAFEHDSFSLYESGAITRYVDEAFDGPPLQPADPKARARMNQAIGILDACVYPDLVWGIYVERVGRPGRDLHAAPMFALFLCTPEGAAMLPRHPRLAAWWTAISARPSFSATAA